MSNYDRSIDDGLHDDLVSGEMEVYATYTGWNFCGEVWWDGDDFKCEVWVHGNPVAVISAPTLQDVMDDVSAEFGGG